MEIKGEAMIVDEAHKKFLCFEYAPNGNLQHYLKEKTHGYEWNMCYQIIKGICQGLGYLHQEHIYHLDLKPANVLLGAKMEPKITDFGLSRCIDGKQSTIFTTNVGGTPGYMAPELIDNQQISCKTDIFSLGIIMIKILTQSDEAPTENWHESLDGDCKLLKKCIEIARSCCDHDPHSRPTIHNIILMLDETETMIQMIPPSINTEPRNDPMSSLYQIGWYI
ncbi:putative cysteine-rich receptor-like protein kinase 39 [Miscanthus floridulus]|uniref:putative cysteine-rich receptor-like protein kinase 39 n=1 Tax=Miscanthus floridulus TaxID=154761 RepID=UPI00345A7CFD